MKYHYLAAQCSQGAMWMCVRSLASGVADIEVRAVLAQ